MMHPNEDPRTPHRLRHERAREFLAKQFPGCLVQRVCSENNGRRVTAHIILANGMTYLDYSVPFAESI